MIAYLIVVILVFFGLFFMVFTPKHFLDLIKIRRNVLEKDQRKIIKKQRRKEILRTKPTTFEKMQSSIVAVINEFEYINLLSYSILTAIGIVIGFTIGQVWNNFFASIILSVVGAAAPYYILNYMLDKRKREKDDKLLIVMADIQSELLQTFDFLNAVRNKLPEIKRTSEELYKHFKWYVDMITKFTPDRNIPYMEELAERVDNYHFSQYIRLAIGFEKGQKALVYTMKSLPTEYGSHLARLRKHEKKVRVQNMSFIMIVAMLPLLIGFLKIMSEDFYSMLTQSLIGQLTLTAVLLVFIVCGFLYTKYNKPVKLK